MSWLSDRSSLIPLVLWLACAATVPQHSDLIRAMFNVYNLNPILNPLRLVRTPIHGSLLSQNLEENNFHILQYLRVSSIVIIQLFFYKPLLGKISLYVVINSSETPLFASIICSLLMSKEEYDLVLEDVWIFECVCYISHNNCCRKSNTVDPVSM